MKLTIVSTEASDFAVSRFAEKAKEMSIEVKIIPVTRGGIATGHIKDELDECVLWRLSDLDSSELAASRGVLSDRIVVNTAMYETPQLIDKFFQQSIIKNSAIAKYAVPTFYAHSIGELKSLVDDGYIKFPLIAKPVDGTRGIGVQLIDSLDQLNGAQFSWSRNIFQTHIENIEEWRVFVTGGVGNGAMLKRKENGSQLNVSSTDIEAEANDEIRQTLYEIGTKAASLFHLEHTGVDIVRDAKTGRYHILEVNSTPGWENGFDHVTGEDIPYSVLKWMKDRYALVHSQDKSREIEKYIVGHRLRLKDSEQKILIGVLFPYSSYVQKVIEHDSVLTPKQAIELYHENEQSISLDSFKDILDTLRQGSGDAKKICEMGDKILHNNFFKISLSEKIEFCYLTRLVNRKSLLENIILQHAEQSISWAGSFIVGNEGRSMGSVSSNHTLSESYFVSAMYCALHHLRV